MAIDISGSMAGHPIATVSEKAKLFAEKYFRSEGNIVNLRTILFNGYNQIIQVKDLESFNREIDARCVASGGTRFTQPLNDILQYVVDKEI